MRTRLLAFVLLAALPSLVLAQRGGGRGGGRSRDAARAPSSRLPTVNDLQDLNPAALLVDKRKKLALSDSAIGPLKALAKTIKDRNAPVLAMYDSVRKRIRSQEGIDLSSAPVGAQLEAQQNQLGLRNLLAQLRQQREKDMQEALALIPEAQKKPAEELLAEQTKEMDELVPRGRGGPPPER